MKIARNISDVAAAGSVTSALRSRGNFARHLSLADLAAEHSIFATLSRSSADLGTGGFTSLLVGIGALVCLLLCVGTLLARAEKHEDASDAESVSSPGGTARSTRRSAATRKNSQGSRTGLFRLTPPPSRREHHPGSAGRHREAHDLHASGWESDDGSSLATSRKLEQDAGGAGGLWGETIRLRDRQSLEVDMGVSGMALASDSANDVRPVLLIACQAFCLQAMILWYIYKTLRPRPNPDVPKDLPLPLMVAAIYLHFVMCVRDLPQSMLLLRQFMKPKAEMVVFGTIFVIDALVVPLVQLFVGALFLCTSMTVADVILNACAVNFISTIDNTILEVYRALDELIEDEDDGDEGKQVELHVPTKLLRVINWTGCIIPIVPGMFSLAMAHVGLDIWKL